MLVIQLQDYIHPFHFGKLVKVFKDNDCDTPTQKEKKLQAEVRNGG